MFTVLIVTDPWSPPEFIFSHLREVPVDSCLSCLHCHTDELCSCAASTCLYHKMINPTRGQLQPAAHRWSVLHSPPLETFASPHLESLEADTLQLLTLDFPLGLLSAWAIATCCKLLLCTFASGRIFFPWLEGTVRVDPPPVFLVPGKKCPEECQPQPPSCCSRGALLTDRSWATQPLERQETEVSCWSSPKTATSSSHLQPEEVWSLHCWGFISFNSPWSWCCCCEFPFLRWGNLGSEIWFILTHRLTCSPSSIF
jgi:hypothetical protein